MSFAEELSKDLTQQFPGVETEVVRPDRVRATVPRESLRQVCAHLRDAQGFEHLSCVSGVDWVERLENVYHIVSYQHGVVLQVTVPIPADDPAVETISDIWKGALFHEREAYDLLGITFTGHPDLRRILLPKDFQFHPLRKDYQGE